MKTAPADIGTFDVVLFLGVLYHMENPLEAVKRVASMTNELAIIETEAVVIPGYDNRAFCEFFESNELNGDYSNWWSPNEKALQGMCRAAGFKRVETVQGPPTDSLCAIQAGGDPISGDRPCLEMMAFSSRLQKHENLKRIYSVALD